MRKKLLGENVGEKGSHVFDDFIEKGKQFFGGKLHDFSIEINYPDDLLFLG